MYWLRHAAPLPGKRLAQAMSPPPCMTIPALRNEPARTDAAHFRHGSQAIVTDQEGNIRRADE